jgi:hypothetical protein
MFGKTTKAKNAIDAAISTNSARKKTSRIFFHLFRGQNLKLTHAPRQQIAFFLL